MWAAAAPLPYYSAYRPQRRRAASAREKDGPPPSLQPFSITSAPSTQLAATSGTLIAADLLEPAVEGPPSPERIRALNQQMRRASILDKHQHQSNSNSSSTSLPHHAATGSSVSASGSLRSRHGSLGGASMTDRPSWERTLENITLSRRSSGRSTASSMAPSRERPESVFGRNFFKGRGGKLKRESSTHSASASSGSSLYSTDMSLEPAATATTAKEQQNFMPSLFGRRKTMKPSEASGELSPQRTKLQISGPYNFQHVTHTRRDHLPNLQRTSRMELVSEFSALRAAQPPTHGALRGIQADDLHFSNFSSEALHLSVGDDEYVGESGNSTIEPPAQPPPHTHILLDHRPLTGPPRHAPPPPGPRRLVKHSRSQEQLRISPPRPPRPPVEQALFPPVPPPRISSRLSIRYDGFDPLATTSLERPQTAGGLFRHPQPFSPGIETSSHFHQPPATSHGFATRSQSADFDGFTSALDPRAAFSHAITTPDDAAWPLPSPGPLPVQQQHFAYEAALSDVAEEEEHYILTRRSRASLISTNSSLRGSHSVPLLRQLAQSQSQSQLHAQRPASRESVTLGHFDLFAAQDALHADEVAVGPNSLARESWEDAIDYCYEHEADADFDYAWDRPSLDLSRDDEGIEADSYGSGHLDPHQPGMAVSAASAVHHDPQSSPNLLSTPSHFDMPALSPASQTSTATTHEALTPTAPAIPVMPVTSNFSLPRQQDIRSHHPQRLHLRTASHASSFKESHGFHLSPSLLIPTDFRHQMTLDHLDDVEYHDDDAADGLIIQHTDVHLPPYDQGVDEEDDGGEEEATMTLASASLGNVRTSAASSEGGSSTSNLSDDAGSSERHVSTTSTWTTLTRLTASTTSLTAHSDGWISKSSMVFPAPSTSDGNSATAPVSPNIGPDAAIDTAVAPQQPTAQLTRAVSRDGFPQPRSPKLGNKPLQRRQRARTTSLSTPPPPGQYAIFPRLYSGNRI